MWSTSITGTVFSLFSLWWAALQKTKLNMLLCSEIFNLTLWDGSSFVTVDFSPKWHSSVLFPVIQFVYYNCCDLNFSPAKKRDVITDIFGPWDLFLTLEDFVVVAESVEPREELECERGIWDRKKKRITIMKILQTLKNCSYSSFLRGMGMSRCGF